MISKKIILLPFIVPILLNSTAMGCESSDERGSSKTPPPPKLTIALPCQDSRRKLTDLISPISAYRAFLCTANSDTRRHTIGSLIAYLEKVRTADARKKENVVRAMLPQWRVILVEKPEYADPDQQETLYNLLNECYPDWQKMHRIESVNWYEIDAP